MSVKISKSLFPRSDGTVVEREIISGSEGWTIYWVHVYGPSTTDFVRRASRIAGAQAHMWASSLGMVSGEWVSGGGNWNGTKGGGNCASVSRAYIFTDSGL